MTKVTSLRQPNKMKKVLAVLITLILVFTFVVFSDVYAVDSTSQIQTLINNLPSTGGVVELNAGIYEISNIKLKSFVTLKGKGRSTILKSISSNTSDAMISLYDENTQQVTISDLTIDGNKSGQNKPVDGIKLDAVNGVFSPWAGDSYHTLENLFIKYCSGDGINIPNVDYQKMRGVVMNNIIVRNCYQNGFNLGGSDNFISNCQSAGNCNGFYIDGGNYSLVNCKSFWNRNVGLYIDEHGTACKISNYEAQEEYSQGVYLHQCIGVQMANIISDTNGHNNGTSTNTGIGILIDGASYCNLSNIGIFNRDCGMVGDIQYAVKFCGSPTYNTITCKVKNMSISKVIEYMNNTIPNTNELNVN